MENLLFLITVTQFENNIEEVLSTSNNNQSDPELTALTDGGESREPSPLPPTLFSGNSKSKIKIKNKKSKRISIKVDNNNNNNNNNSNNNDSHTIILHKSVPESTILTENKGDYMKQTKLIFERFIYSNAPFVLNLFDGVSKSLIEKFSKLQNEEKDIQIQCYFFYICFIKKCRLLFILFCLLRNVRLI